MDRALNAVAVKRLVDQMIRAVFKMGIVYMTNGFVNVCATNCNPKSDFTSDLCLGRTGVVQTPQHCALVYVRAVRSGKERPDKSNSEEKSTSLGYKSH